MKQFLSRDGIAEQINNAKNYYTRLSDREQIIFLLSCAGGFIFLLFLIYSIVLASNASLASDIEKNRKNLQTIADLGEKYRKITESIDQFERMIAQTPPNFQLASELEMLAQQNQVKIESIKAQAGSPNEYYLETKAVISIGEIQILPLIKFLYSIENSMKPMRISTLQIKPNFKDSKLLNVNFVVSTFQHQQ